MLGSDLRKQLENVCVAGRREAYSACRAVLEPWDVWGDRPPAFLDGEQRLLRRGLRARSAQLGDNERSIELLAAECAYEQWHRLLFARFLAENRLLIHPEFGAPISVAECDELAESLGEPDGWSVAARFAAEILPGIFRLDDPALQLRLTPDGLARLEGLVESLPPEVFAADDALGWVYQYWQSDKKDEVNASERKIGGADIGPVTQLFTENYMVRFLLENSLGAWWATRHPESPLLKDWEYLRFDEDGAPAAGSFDGWPETVGEVTVMDPCCGSGHFLVEAFSMFWQMRAEEESLPAVAAQDAVLRDNLFGLELDPRCVQIAMFAVALTAWKAGGGWRELPTPNIACSGIPVKAPVDEWKALAGGDERLENALVRLHILFRDADTLGSLIDPKRAVEISDPTGLQSSFDDVEWDDIAPLLLAALTRETNDPAIAVLGADAIGIARAADYLSCRYTLVTTNPPYLGIRSQVSSLIDWVALWYPNATDELAYSFSERLEQQSETLAIVMPHGWLFMRSYTDFRVQYLRDRTWQFVGWLGAGAFEAISGEVVQPVLWISTHTSGIDEFNSIDVANHPTRDTKAAGLREDAYSILRRSVALGSAGQVVAGSQSESPALPTLAEYGEAATGLLTGDGEVFLRQFWELAAVDSDWQRLQSTPSSAGAGGHQQVILWEDESGKLSRWAASVRHLNHAAQAWRRGKPLWGQRGIAVQMMGDLRATIYEGDRFDANVVVYCPDEKADLAAFVAFADSGALHDSIRTYYRKLGITVSTLLDCPFDLDHWRAVAEQQFPDGLPEAWSDDPTQWLFEGRPDVATEPLQVAVGRLLGYSWPEQPESDDLDELADEDGIVCLPSVVGERPAADRLEELLARSFDDTWSPGRAGELLAETGSKKKDLESWLRQDFFKHHCQVFKNRPFVWHIWDGRNDGFAALVNYHRLDRATLERLTYSYLGDWIERQQAAVADDVAGADARLAAAQGLQGKLALILEGEPPHDIYVRWKELHEQPVGWDPDINDGVRLNVRPFVEAGVLRHKFNVHWKKDRGKNPDGSERYNDFHYTVAEKQAVRPGIS